MAHGELLALRNMVTGANRRQQIHDERQDIAREDERNRPFQNSTGVLATAAAVHADSEANGQANLDNNESKFDEETGQQNTMFATIEDSNAKVLAANQDRADDISSPTNAIISYVLRTQENQTHKNRPKNPSCSLGWCLVSKIERRINPAAPAIAKKIERTAHALSSLPLLAASCFECRSHLSERNARSKNTTVTTLPPMKSGWRRSAPTLEMYLGSIRLVLPV